MKSKISGQWKDVDPRAKISGSWKNINEGWAKVNGVWQPVYGRYPKLSGGTLTSDSTYYYMDFTSSTSTAGTTTGTLVVQHKPITIDYVLVGGGGPAIRDYYITERYYGLYYTDRPIIAEAGGSAGAVLSGSTTLNPGVYTISVGAGGPGGTGKPTSATVHEGVKSFALNGLIEAGGGRVPMSPASTSVKTGSGSIGYSSNWNSSFEIVTGRTPYAPGALVNSGSLMEEARFYVYNYNFCDGMGGGIIERGTGGAASGPASNGVFYACLYESLSTYFTPSDTVIAQSVPPIPGVSLLGLTVGASGGIDGPIATPNSGNGGNSSKYFPALSGASGVFRIRFAKSQVGG